MSKKTDKDTKKSQVEEVNPEVVEDDDADSPWYYFYSQGCGWCKKSEPIVDELIADGHDILKLDLAVADNRALNDELKSEYNIQCGTPWFINEATGKGICGFREKDVLEKWLAGEDIPAPPRPKGPMPRPPFMDAPEADVNKWKEEYSTWLKENDHLPDTQKKSAEEILAQPRPKSNPPAPPRPDMTDEQFDKWGKEYDEWKEKNSHLPNLQPAATIVQRMKAARKQQGAPTSAPSAPSAPTQAANINVSGGSDGKLNSLDAKIQALEVKVDKIIAHFGIK